MSGLLASFSMLAAYVVSTLFLGPTGVVGSWLSCPQPTLVPDRMTEECLVFLQSHRQASCVAPLHLGDSLLFLPKLNRGKSFRSS